MNFSDISSYQPQCTRSIIPLRLEKKFVKVVFFSLRVYRRIFVSVKLYTPRKGVKPLPQLRDDTPLTQCNFFNVLKYKCALIPPPQNICLYPLPTI